ncbi:MAG: glycosyltransferase family 4 protein [Pseudomonadota bacterium]
MKAPDSPVPSGDRTFARLIIAALEGSGHTVVRPPQPITWRKSPPDFAALADEANRAAQAAVNALKDAPPDVVLTYHNYHKAPDLMGPLLADAFDVPFAIVEASRAPRRANGPWAEGFAAADRALLAADAVGAVTQHDKPQLLTLVPGALVEVAPFIDVRPFAGAHPGEAAQQGEAAQRGEGFDVGEGAHVVTTVMMRGGRKAESLKVLAKAWALIAKARPDARITVAGDGPERTALEPLFPPGAFVGRLNQADLASLFCRADLFIWPAIDEPFGFVFLEAQAAGLPVIGGNARGVRDVVRDSVSGLLVPPTAPDAIAHAALTLLGDDAKRAAMGEAARAFAHQNDLVAGQERLKRLIDHARARHQASKGGVVRARPERLG